MLGQVYTYFIQGGIFMWPILLFSLIALAVIIELFIVPSRDPSGPFGAKAAAEIPTDGVAPAIVNAICDATGVRLREIPATPERVWRALKQRD